MHRFTSKLSIDEPSEKWKIPYLDIIAVGIIQLLLALLILCYGIYLMCFVLEENYNLRIGLWIVITFVATSKITSPWVESYCKYLDNVRSRVHKRNIILAATFLSSALICSSLSSSSSVQIVLYGICGGFLSAYIHVHLKFSTSETFRNRSNFYENLNQIVVKPLCLILTPHFVLFLINNYGSFESELILGGFVLNVIPFCLLTKTRKELQRLQRLQRTPLCKFQTVERLSIEMTDLTPKTPSVVVDTSSSSEESDEEELEINPEPGTQNQSTSNVQIYYQNVGVKILPNIPEENESEEDEDINEISSKRLSRISAILQGLNENHNKDLTLSITNLFEPDEGAERVENTEDEEVEYPEELRPKKARCFSISSDTAYAFVRRRERVKSFLKEHFIKSFPRTLSKVCFYPAVISNSVTTFISIVVLASTPYVMLAKNRSQNNAITTVDASFLLTIMGFTWLFFLTGFPIWSRLSSFKIKLLFLIGLSISGFSLFIAQKFSYDNFTLFSLTYGLGYGIVTYTEEKAYEDFFGNTNWKNLKAALEISVGFIVILIYLTIYLFNFKIDDILTYAYWAYVFLVSLWILAFILKRIVIQMKNIRRYNHEKYPTFTYF